MAPVMVWFDLVCRTEEGIDGGFDIDDFQLVFDEYNKQIRINLSGEQVEKCKRVPSLMTRIAAKLADNQT